MSIELLTVDPKDYVESRGAELSDYEMRGAHTHNSGYVVANELEAKIDYALSNFIKALPNGTEAVVKMTSNISLGGIFESFDLEINGPTAGTIYAITMDGTALIPKKKPSDGKELRTAVPTKQQKGDYNTLDSWTAVDGVGGVDEEKQFVGAVE